MKPERAYYAFVALMTFGWGATATGYPVFQRFIHLSNAQIFLVEVVFNLVLFTSEVPTGMLADGKGRAYSLGIGASLLAFSLFAIGFSGSFWSVLPGFVLLGIAAAFLSGAQDAWLKDAMDAEGRGKDYGRVQGQTVFISGFTMWLGGLTGTFSLLHSPRDQWLISGACGLGMLVIVLLFMAGKGNPQHRVKETHALAMSLNALRDSSALRWAVGASLVFPFFWVAHLQWQPKTYDTAGMSALLIGWTALCAGISLAGFLKRFMPHNPLSIIVGLIVMSSALVLLSMPVSGMMSVYLFALWFGKGLFDPAMSTFVQERISSEYRATYGSLQSFLGRIATTLIFLLMSWRSLDLAYETAVNSVFLLSGICMLAGTGLLLVLIRWALTPVSQPQTVVSAAPLPSPVRDD